MLKYKTLELFCGTKSFSKVLEKHGHETFTIDDNEELAPSLCENMFNVDAGDFQGGFDILWASPPCEAFSVAAIGKNWNKDCTPKHERAELAQQLVLHTLALIREIKPKWWFIENPRGMLRKMPFMDEFLREQGGVRHTVTYCQYGDIRMKPTDIWTNAHWWNPKTACKNGFPCHEAAPRGSRTGTQGISGARDRGIIPELLFEEILNHLGG